MNTNPLTSLTHTFKRVHIQAFDLTIIPSSDYSKACKKCKTETYQEQEEKEHEFIESYNTLIKKCNLVPIVGELFRNKKVYFSENVLKSVYSYDLIKVSMLSKDTIGEQERLIDEMNKEQEFYKLAQEWGVADVVPKVMEEQGEEEGEIVEDVLENTKGCVVDESIDETEEGEIDERSFLEF